MKRILLSGILVFAAIRADATNSISNTILALSEEKQNALWLLALKSENCDQVIRSMYQGGTPAGDESWSVGCRNGNDFSVGISSDTAASIKVLTCKELVAIDTMLMAQVGKQPSGLGCWKKYD